MHTAQVKAWGQPPQYLEINDPAPTPESSEIQIRVSALGLHRVVRSRAAGTHYSSKNLPHTPGIDGIGYDPDGRAVYFSTLGSGRGTYSSTVNVPATSVTLLPAGVDQLQAAALINPGISSWMAMRNRTTKLPANFSVVVMGATSASGTIAIELARALGAGKVVGVARNEEKLAALDLDASILLRSPATETDFSGLGDVDLVLDYVYGPPAAHLLQSLKSSRPVQYVHIGALDSTEMNLPAAILRSKDLTIRGSGLGSWTPQQVEAEIPELLQAIKGIKKREVKEVPLSQIEKVWNEKGDRIVFVP
ncbi:NAD(P)-binding protein [Glonium stellatum]|uniref:NAD(P)-binding protein n=1 Tax=Glonium stellatum TaxID=574774 RepID=A0A8E2EYJ1_9PEZI|nr:NAD(P)-binding protein [Glonium stellatum]